MNQLSSIKKKITQSGLTKLQKKMAFILLFVNGPENAMEFIRRIANKG